MTTPLTRAAFAMDPHLVDFVFGNEERGRLDRLVDVDWQRTEIDPGRDRDVELLITGWGVPPLTDAVLATLPRLRAVVHWGGGTGFVGPAARARGIRVSSARAANAVPVAEFTIAMITLAAKDVFWIARRYAREQRGLDREAEFPTTGMHGVVVGIIGASSVGTLVLERLRSFDATVLLHDPTVSPERARDLGAELITDVVELAGRSGILSVHAPELPQTLGLVSAEVLDALPDGATIINTARGSIVDQDALERNLSTGRIRAILDVTDPEVLPHGHPFYSLPNVFLTPHLAGSMGNELRRLGTAAVDEVERYVHGEPFATPAPA